VVLYYHGVPDASLPGFTAQMNALVQKAKPLAAGWQGDLRPGNLFAAVTFDDAFVSVLHNAIPVLEKRGIPATIFVPTGYLGTFAGWIKDPVYRESRGKIMDRNELLSALRHPNVTVGSHTISHPRLDSLGEAELARELVESKRQLEDAVGDAVSLFSLPHGIYSLKALEVARAAGYSRVFGIQPTCAHHELNSFFMGRVMVTPEDWPLEFKLKLQGAYRWFARNGSDLRKQAPSEKI
jgi:peptidoglycan/xylan/chitin deacetylase (PgdA/CDA1 family)